MILRFEKFLEALLNQSNCYLRKSKAASIIRKNQKKNIKLHGDSDLSGTEQTQVHRSEDKVHSLYYAGPLQQGLQKNKFVV